MLSVTAHVRRGGYVSDVGADTPPPSPTLGGGG
jgi:hypothetical protein